MKYKTQFRLVVKSIALLMALQTAAPFVNYAFLVGAGFVAGQALPMQSFQLSGFLAYLIGLILSILIFFKPNFIVNLAIPSNKPYCPECGYQLVQPLGSYCSECGTALPNNLRDEASKDSEPDS